MRNLCKQYRLSLKMVKALEVFQKDPVQILGFVLKLLKILLV